MAEVVSHPPSSTGNRSRRAVSPRWVLLGLLVSFVVALGVARAIYQHYVAFERVAARHLVPDADAAVRLELEQVTLYDPFRRHLLPLVHHQEAAPADNLKPRLERLKQLTRLELGVDIRELVFSRGDGNWALALAGLFPKQGVVPGLGRVLEEEGHPVSLDSRRQVLAFVNGTVMTQASDGVVVIASDVVTLEAVRRQGDEHRKLGLSEKAALSAFVEGAWRSGSTGGEPRGLVEPLRATLRLEEANSLAIVLHHAGGLTARDATAWLSGLLRELTGTAPTSLRLVVSGPNQLSARVAIEPSQLDHGIRWLAGVIEEAAFSRR